MDGIKGNLDDHLTLINNSDFITVGYDRLAMQVANGGGWSRLATLGGLSTVGEQNIAMFSGTG